MRSISVRFSIQMILAIIMAFLVGSIPYLLFNMKALMMIKRMLLSGELSTAAFLGFDVHFRWDRYFDHIKASIDTILHPGAMDYFNNGVAAPLFPEFLDKYAYSLTVLIASLVLAFCLSVLLSVIVMLSPELIKKAVRTFFNAAQSIPDIFYLMFIILGVVLLYEKTHILLFQTVSYKTEIYFLPIFVLTAIPTLQISQYLFLNLEDELTEPYVEFAESKGLRRLRVLIVHVLRNALIAFLSQLKTIFWFGLSNLIMIEIILNMDGFMRFLVDFGPFNPEVVTLGMIMILVPFISLFFISELLVNKLTNRSREGEV